MSTSTDTNPMLDMWTEYSRKMAEDGMQFFQKNMAMAQQMAPGAPTDLMNLWVDNYKDMMGHLQGQPMPENPRQLYQLWVDTWSQSLERYMRTPEFAAQSGRDLALLSDFAKRSGQLLETYWETLHLPSAADMREVYQKITTMDRKLDDVDRKLRQLLEAKETPSNSGSKKA